MELSAWCMEVMDDERGRKLLLTKLRLSCLRRGPLLPQAPNPFGAFKTD
jgi:hypothetical protein